VNRRSPDDERQTMRSPTGHERYELDDDPARVDVDAAWTFLSTGAYWGRWRSAEDFRRQVVGAWRVVGCYGSDGQMVGFARSWSGCTYTSARYADATPSDHDRAKPTI
jgi:hypothetical protein